MLKNKIKYLLCAALCLALFAGISIYAVHMKNMKVNADETKRKKLFRVELLITMPSFRKKKEMERQRRKSEQRKTLF